MTTFTHTTEDKGTSVEFLAPDGLTVEELIEIFERFMLAMGYHENTVKKYFGPEETEE